MYKDKQVINMSICKDCIRTSDMTAIRLLPYDDSIRVVGNSDGCTICTHHKYVDELVDMIMTNAQSINVDMHGLRKSVDEHWSAYTPDNDNTYKHGTKYHNIRTLIEAFDNDAYEYVVQELECNDIIAL